MTPGAKHESGIRSLRYLDASESGVINAIKQDIGDFTARLRLNHPKRDYRKPWQCFCNGPLFVKSL
jgi:hypothetical protein